MFIIHYTYFYYIVIWNKKFGSQVRILMASLAFSNHVPQIQNLYNYWVCTCSLNILRAKFSKFSKIRSLAHSHRWCKSCNKDKPWMILTLIYMYILKRLINRRYTVCMRHFVACMNFSDSIRKPKRGRRILMWKA